MNQSPFSSKILIVEDASDDRRLLFNALSDQGYQVSCAEHDSIGFKEIQNNLPDLILLGINLSDANGYQVWEQIQADEATNRIPVIFLGTGDNIQFKQHAWQTDGLDWIDKPWLIDEILARVKQHLSLQQAQAKINSLNNTIEQRVKEHISAVEAANRLLQQELAQRDRLEAKLRHDALHDSLTKLPNRSLLMQKIAQCLNKAIANPGEKFALLFIDLDRFKIINDSLGHLAGDELLVACAERLGKCVDREMTLARLGGDEFTVLLEEVEDVGDGVAVAEKILAEFALPFNLGSRNLTIAVSIGIALGDSKYQREIDLLRDADTALYRAKELGKERYEVFTQQMYLDAISRLELENELREAISNRQLRLYYQPIISFESMAIAGFEALVRWEHPTRGLVSPGEFIPLAEETGLILSLGEWVMMEACSQLKTWRDRFPGAKSLTMSINVTAEQLHDSSFMESVDRIITTTQVDPQYLKLEMTESMLIEDTEKLLAVLQAIKKRQIQLSLDDFGTGYSSLSYLPQFPLDILKIDQSFVRAMNSDPQNLAIIKTIITLAQVLEMKIIAEGIESDRQAQTLQFLKVDFGQGSLFSKPLAPKEVEVIIAEGLKISP